MYNVVTSNKQLFPETLKWKRGIEAVGGSFEWDSVFLANNFIANIRNKSYYAKIRYLLPLLGKGINAARMPLIDTISAGISTSVNFVDADFSQRTGLQGASNKYFNLLFNGGQLGVSGNGGAGFWPRTVSMAADVQYGLGMLSSNGYGIRTSNTGTDNSVAVRWGVITATSPATLNEVRSAAHFYGQRSNITSRVLYKNGVQAASSSESAGTTDITSQLFYASALNASGTAGSFWLGASSLIYCTNGELTADEILDFHHTLQAFIIGPTGR
jgi:hypothetical protein